MKLTASKRMSRLEVKSADAIQAMAEAERKKKAEEARRWAMLLHFYEDNSGPCFEEAKVMLQRVLKHVNDIGEPDIDKMSFGERAFWYMLNDVFELIEPELLIQNEIEYQLDKILGEDEAQEFRSKTTVSEQIMLLDEHLGPSWRAIQLLTT